VIAMSRVEKKSIRVDLRIPKDLIDKIQRVAVERFNAPTHHISKKPELTPTIIQLIH
jgi:hypothetical protein